jgi:hypothetical protein
VTLPTEPADAPFHASLRGADEVPPVQTSDTGEFRATQAGLGIEFTLTAQGQGLTMAHIHAGAPGVNGPIVVTLFMSESDQGVDGINVTSAITPSMLQGDYAGKFNQFVQDMEAGKFYVNVHSVDHPDGVMRGQLEYTEQRPGAPQGPPPHAPNTGSGVMTDSGTPVVLVLSGIAAILVVATLGGWLAMGRRR